jgi:hypothetical protein
MKFLLVLPIYLIIAMPVKAESNAIRSARWSCQANLVDAAAEKNDWIDARTVQTRCACLANARAQDLSTHACPGWDVAGQWVRKYMD